jgi:CRP-like cAMP-binding protein
MDHHSFTPGSLLKRLRTFDFLQGVEQDSLEHLAEQAIWRVYAPDAVVFWEGDVETHLYYIQYGSIKVLKTSTDGRTTWMGSFPQLRELFTLSSC